ncbi:MAG: alpha/beta fold hydrolase [Phycisphaeraceae bacterium]|nr:alpha/beta fold hydrolase [Phycisphaeraceae bacterium]
MHQFPIEIDNEGMSIRGTVYTPDRAKRHPTVLLLHGFTGQRIEAGFFFVQLARDLCDRNIAAVTFDFRHSGESDGSFDRMLVTGELSDTLRMAHWVQGQPFVDRSRMGLLGFSLGGLLAACTVARTGQFKALTLLAPTTVNNLHRHAGGKPDGEPVVMGPHVLHADFFKDLRTLNPVADVVKNPRPTLLVQGDADTAVPPEVSQAFVDAMQRAGVPVEVARIAEGDHVFSTPATRKQARETVTGWLARVLISP